ncbi:STAS domain-containing protein, partial [Streptomyces sp. NPDC006386]|uniref:STAS domain-containing protein n=1 Tax=Streptomyces sp. NPDC006386 TaxID=3156762 RepID=UPI0033AFFFCB
APGAADAGPVPQRPPGGGFDCSGLRLLYRARSRVLDRGGYVLLVCSHPLTLRVLRITGLSRLLPPQPTLDAALQQPEATSRP